MDRIVDDSIDVTAWPFPERITGKPEVMGWSVGLGYLINARALTDAAEIIVAPYWLSERAGQWCFWQWYTEGTL